MSWQWVTIILGVIWVLPVMYVIKWYYMNKMFSRSNLQGVDLKQTYTDLLEQANEIDPDQPTEPYAAEG